ncbi:MAG: MotA/TolQ/ExbB proton channel family protein [Verrucomicrobia bacterium]|jgi:biopolymer transport protein ExbB|nr:MotA/TolQ/ExbB proton channel family protein [Verrucomicrobiota bacterium]
MISLDVLTLGGPVIWIILAIGCLAFGVFVERSLSLHRARIRVEDFLKGVINILGRENIPEALTICEDTPGPVAYIVKTAIQHRHAEKEDLLRTLEDASQAEISRMERRLVVIASVAQLAPMLGLLGTILGMVEGFLAMRAQAPLVHSGHLMDSILTALTTTAAGLMVAIPCYAAFNLLVIKIDRIVLDVERTRTEIVAYLTGTRGAAGESQ